MLEDAQSLVVTTDSPVAIAAINQFTHEALRYGNAAEAALVQGLGADPDCALLHAYWAAYCLSQEERLFQQRAVPHVQIAQSYLPALTEREQWTVQAVAAWAAGDIHRAIGWQETIVAHYPHDLLAIQQAQYHYFYTGDSTRLLTVAETALAANPDNHYLYGMVAFGLEQCHRWSEAEEMAHRAIALNRNDPWAHHAIAHVLDAQNRIEEGIAWMESHADTWETCNSMLYTHNWWHIALYYLAQGAFSTVLNLYDQHLWGRARRDSPKDQVGAIATLARLELHGVDVGKRWQVLMPYLTPRLHEHCLPFQDLHYVYALSRSGQPEAVTDMLASMEHHSQRINPASQAAWTEVALPAARGIAAYGLGHRAEAIAHLQPVLPRLAELGGSQTQRALFQQFYQQAMQPQQTVPSHLHRLGNEGCAHASLPVNTTRSQRSRPPVHPSHQAKPPAKTASYLSARTI